MPNTWHVGSWCGTKKGCRRRGGVEEWSRDGGGNTGKMVAISSAAIGVCQHKVQGESLMCERLQVLKHLSPPPLKK